MEVFQTSMRCFFLALLAVFHVLILTEKAKSVYLIGCQEEFGKMKGLADRTEDICYNTTMVETQAAWRMASFRK